MRGLGQIADLAALAEPDIARVTNVGPAHLELLGTLRAIAAAEMEARAPALPADGDGRAAARRAAARALAARRPARDRRSARRPTADVRCCACEPGRAAARRGLLDVARRATSSCAPLRAPHQALNLAAAALRYACAALGVARGAGGAARPTSSSRRWRGEELELPGGGVLVNDAYNANPPRWRARSGGARRARRRRAARVAVLGQMAELGAERAGAARRGRARGARALGVDVVVGGRPARAPTCAARRRRGARRIVAADAEAAAELLRPLLRPGDVVLRQGLALGGLERLAAGSPAGDRRVTRCSPPACSRSFLTVRWAAGFIAFLRDPRIGQNIREEGPQGHKTKQGTPTMGGLLILTVGGDLPFLIFTERTRRRR